MTASRRRFLAAAAGAVAVGVGAARLPARAGDEVDLKGQTINMLVGYGAGGGADATARALLPLLRKYLPGQPTIIIRYMPGANGIVAFNYLAHQVKPDGSTCSVGTAEQVDPFNWRAPGASYNPRDFPFFGGIQRGGNALLINREAEKRLYDRNAEPVIMGTIGSWPRAASQVTLWGIAYLGWNARWVTGYQATNDLILALRRGEIDMTATANLFQVKDLLDGDKFHILNQSGLMKDGKAVGRPDFGDVPLVADLLRSKISDPLGQKAFKYWFNITALDKILALVPNTPAPIVTAYRDAFRKSVDDPEFSEIGKRITEEFMPMSYQDVEAITAALADTADDVLQYLTSLLTKQGLQVGLQVKN